MRRSIVSLATFLSLGRTKSNFVIGRSGRRVLVVRGGYLFANKQLFIKMMQMMQL